MTGLVLLFVVLALASLIVGVVTHTSETRRKQRLVDELHRVDERIARDAQEAKRAMHDASGQSWRNQFE